MAAQIVSIDRLRLVLECANRALADGIKHFDVHTGRELRTAGKIARCILETGRVTALLPPSGEQPPGA